MESGPFSPVWDEYRERLNKPAEDMAKDALRWMNENQDVLTEQARYMKKVDMGTSSNQTVQIAIEFDFSGIRKEGPGYSIGYADKHEVKINVPHVTFRPNDDKLDK